MQMEHCATHPRQLISHLLLSISASLFLSIASVAHADDVGVNAVQLQLKPNRCVALHQGQVCYQNIQLSWSAQQVSNYCLYQQFAEAPLYCWQGVVVGQYQYEFASDTATQLRLVNMQTNGVVATTEVGVAWVYKANTRRKTHWRLF